MNVTLQHCHFGANLTSLRLGSVVSPGVSHSKIFGHPYDIINSAVKETKSLQ